MLSLLMWNVAACGMECYALQENRGFSTGDKDLDNCGNICRAGHSFLFFAVSLRMLGVHSPPLLSPSIVLEWEAGGEGSDGWEQYVEKNSVRGVRIQSEGDEAQKLLFRNALKPGHSYSSILVKGVLRLERDCFLPDIQIPET